ncbi:MAG TPA: sigma-70 family RNA polymerase sigma factor, partial [Mycobacteriales bacterium]
MTTTPTESLTDTELIAAARGPVAPRRRLRLRTETDETDLTSAAYGQLWERHADAARNLARQLTRSDADTDDLVAEAFARVLDVLRSGGGPETAFRPYLLTTVRNTFYDKTRRDRRLTLSDDMDEHDPGVPFDDTALSGLESTLAARAFARLPERWQTVLWHTEVEGAEPADVAPLLGLSPNAVSALAYRAREGLRQAYLQVHLSTATDRSCQITVENLGAWTRNGLARRDAVRVERHLSGCADCRALADELLDINSGLRGIIAPLVLGAPLVAGYLKASKASAGSGAGAAGSSAAGTGGSAASSAEAGTSSAAGTSSTSVGAAGSAGAVGSVIAGAGAVKGALWGLARLPAIGAAQVAAGATSAAVVGTVVAGLVVGGGGSGSATAAVPGLPSSRSVPAQSGPGSASGQAQRQTAPASGVQPAGLQVGGTSAKNGLRIAGLPLAAGPVGVSLPNVSLSGPVGVSLQNASGRGSTSLKITPAVNLTAPTVAVSSLVRGTVSGLAVTLHNAGRTTATGVSLDVSLPTGVLSRVTGACNGGGAAAHCALPALLPGVSVSVPLPLSQVNLNGGLVNISVRDSSGHSAQSAVALPLVNASLPNLPISLPTISTSLPSL